jgi:ribonuclease P protein component
MKRGRQTFPKDERLRKRSEYTKLFARGKRCGSSHLLLFCQANQKEKARLGITASRKVGTAVTRNRVKRLIREFYRQHKELFASGYDFSLVVKRSFGRLTKKEAEAQLSSLLLRSRKYISS